MRSQPQPLGAKVALVTAIVVAALLFGGCGISVSKDEKGQDKKVDIVSPFGSLHVNTDINVKDIGIPVYPGAHPRQDSSDDKHRANVNIDSSFFGVKVVAAEFESDDPMDKVVDYYRGALKQFGSVLECKGDRGTTSVNAKPGESRDLTCDDNERKNGANMELYRSANGVELKVGTTDHQHVVGVRTEGGKTRFGLVYVRTRGKGESM